MLVSCLASVFVFLCWEILRRIPAWKKALDEDDWPAIEADILRLARLMASELMTACLNWHLDRNEIRQQGKELAQKQGISPQGTRDVRVTLATGSKIVVHTTPLMPCQKGVNDVIIGVCREKGGLGSRDLIQC